MSRSLIFMDHPWNPCISLEYPWIINKYLGTISMHYPLIIHRFLWTNQRYQWMIQREREREGIQKDWHFVKLFNFSNDRGEAPEQFWGAPGSIRCDLTRFRDVFFTFVWWIRDQEVIWDLLANCNIQGPWHVMLGGWGRGSNHVELHARPPSKTVLCA